MRKDVVNRMIHENVPHTFPEPENGACKMPPKKEKWFTLKQKIALVLSVNAFVALSVLLFAPMEVYLGNINEFAFPFNHIWWLLLVCSVLITLVVGAVECLLPDKIFLAANIAVFAVGLCCYIQSLALNGQMGSLTGGEKVYGRSLVLVNLLIWLLIFAAVIVLTLVLIKRKKRQILTTILEFVSLAIVAMQTVAFVSLLTAADMASFQKTDYLTTEGEFELSGKNNVVVFILDSCDWSYIDNTLKRYPDLLDEMKGFTYYTNAVSTHSRTYPSIPYMLTGEICYFDKPYQEYINQAYAGSRFLPRIYETGADIRIFTEAAFIGDSAKSQVSNCALMEQEKLSVLSIPDLLKQMLKISLYREMPYAAKPQFQYESSAVNDAVLNLPDQYAAGDDALFFSQFQEKGLTVNSEYPAAFRFYHLNGAHIGSNIDENAVRTEKTDMESALKGNFHILDTYIQQMQQLGIYENSTIIVTADHGFSSADSYENLEVRGATGPLFMIKPAGKGSGDPLVRSDAPVGHLDLFPTILKAFGAEYQDFGRPADEIGEMEARDRYYYFSAFVSDEDGEIVLREYRIRGDARDLNNWSLTGRNWDIQYSQRAVSKKRFQDLIKQPG